MRHNGRNLSKMEESVRDQTLTQRRIHPSQMIWPLIVGIALLLAQTVAAAAQSRPDTFADLAEQVSPSVVNITTSTTVATNAQPGPVVPDGSPFEDFFRDFMDRNGQGGPNGPAPRRSQALGSGFVISEDGFIVTNNHVIQGADEILIEFFEGFELEAEIIGTDPNTDLALLKVESDEPLKFVSFGDSEGVATAFLDLLYNDELVSIVETEGIRYGELFAGTGGSNDSTFMQGSLDIPGLIDEIGGVIDLLNSHANRQGGLKFSQHLFHTIGNFNRIAARFFADCQGHGGEYTATDDIFICCCSNSNNL